MLQSSIKLALVDDHLLFRKTLETFLADQPNIEVAIQASDVMVLMHKMKENPVDILVLDIFLPAVSVFDALKLIRHEYPDLKIITLSMCTDLSVISNLLEQGIYGCVSKADDPSELLQAIESVAENKIYRNRLFTDALYWNKQPAAHVNNDENGVSLNDRELKIVKLIWEEKSNKEIADHVFLSVRSVEKIRQDIKEKINVKSTVGLLKYAIRKKIIGVNAAGAVGVN